MLLMKLFFLLYNVIKRYTYIESGIWIFKLFLKILKVFLYYDLTIQIRQFTKAHNTCTMHKQRINDEGQNKGVKKNSKNIYKQNIK